MLEQNRLPNSEQAERNQNRLQKEGETNERVGRSDSGQSTRASEKECFGRRRSNDGSGPLDRRIVNLWLNERESEGVATIFRRETSRFFDSWPQPSSSKADLWTQYAELGGIGDNPPIEVDPNETLNNYQVALSNLDADGPQYITSNTMDEVSHATFLNAYLRVQRR